MEEKNVKMEVVEQNDTVLNEEQPRWKSWAVWASV